MKYAAPIGSTGWYMPSIGELIEVFNAFAVSSDGAEYSLSASDFLIIIKVRKIS